MPTSVVIMATKKLISVLISFLTTNLPTKFDMENGHPPNLSKQPKFFHTNINIPLILVVEALDFRLKL